MTEGDGQMAGPDVIGGTALSKAFGGVQAVREVSFSASAGEVHAIVGENGAGKSTLVRVFAGVLPPDGGTVLLDGAPVQFAGPRGALRAGIRMIHQDFTLVPDLNVVENVFLGQLVRGSSRLVDWSAMRKAASGIFARLGVEIELNQPVRRLSVAQQQLVEIAKALATAPRVLIMDEPSAVLAGQDLERLFRVIEALRAEGVCILYISHRLDEVFRIADRVTVMRNGEVVIPGRPLREVTPDGLVAAMLGRSLGEAVPARQPVDATDRLVVRGLSAWGFLRDIDLRVRRGEIVGVAGLVGAGRSTLLRAIFGADRRAAGEVLVDGRPVPNDVGSAIRAGIGFLPEDRKGLGLILPFSVRSNLTLAVLDRVGRGGVLSPPVERALAIRVASQVDVRFASLEQPVEQLSGGNQQKVALGKWLARRPVVLLLDEPTRGVDVGAKREIYHLLRVFAGEGMAILMTSSELGELFALCDQLLVMRDGRIVRRGRPAEMREEEVLAAAATRTVEHR